MALQHAGGFHYLVEEWTDCEELRPKPKEKWVFMEKKSENTRHRTEWSVEADKYRCMSCGRGNKCIKMPGTCTRPKLLSTILRKWRRRLAVRGSDMVQKVFGTCEAKNGTETFELLQTGTGGYQRIWQKC